MTRASKEPCATITPPDRPAEISDGSLVCKGFFDANDVWDAPPGLGKNIKKVEIDDLCPEYAFAALKSVDALLSAFKRLSTKSALHQKRLCGRAITAMFI